MQRPHLQQALLLQHICVTAADAAATATAVAAGAAGAAAAGAACAAQACEVVQHVVNFLLLLVQQQPAARARGHHVQILEVQIKFKVLGGIKGRALVARLDRQAGRQAAGAVQEGVQQAQPARGGGAAAEQVVCDDVLKAAGGGKSGQRHGGKS